MNCFDEGRLRRAVTNIAFSIAWSNGPAEVKWENVPTGLVSQTREMYAFMTQEDSLYDVDKSPSFVTPTLSYCGRLKKNGGLQFVVERLTKYPESKKAVITFPLAEDYSRVLASPDDDYLPCLLAVQFRLHSGPKNRRLVATIIWRSLDAWQKMLGNVFGVISWSESIRKALSVSLHEEIVIREIDGFISDAHVYEDCFVDSSSYLGVSASKYYD